MTYVKYGIGLLLMAATIAAGVIFDILVLLVGGIEEIVRGVQMNPMSGHDIGWGAAHVVFSGVGTFAAVLLCILWAVLFFGYETKRSHSRQGPVRWS